jgi:NTP pyrophosphatase (non-canonical NTP hydrolase)
MKKLIEDNYKSTVDRGLITPTTNAFNFIDKIYEEVAELEEVLNTINDKEPKKEMFYNFNEELSDIILVCLNCAKHLNIDIETELENKIKKNYERAANKRMDNTNSTI